MRLHACVPLLIVAIAACSKAGPDRVEQVALAADSADQLLITMRTTLTNLGVKQADVEADSAFVYENSGRTELKILTVKFFTTTGVQTSTLNADFGVYLVRTQEMEARGNVVVVRSDGARLTTSVLRYNQIRNEVTTDQAYTYVEGDRRVQGQGFVSDPTFSNITTQGVRGSGGRFTLPGQ